MLNSKNQENSIKKRNSYSLKFKQKALVALAKNNNNYQNTAKRLGISRQSLMKWAKQKNKILNTNFKNIRRRVQTSANRAFYPTMENSLNEWIKDSRARGVCISGFSLKVKAIEIMREDETQTNMPQFKASDGWLFNFLRRKKLTLRRITTTGRDLPTNSANIIRNFIDDCSNRFTNINRAQIINMDEIAVYIDYPSNYTYDYKGKFFI